MATHHAVVAVRRSPSPRRAQVPQRQNGDAGVYQQEQQQLPPGAELLSSVPGGPGSSVLVGDVRVEGSADVLFDNVTVFEGPVTVQQIHVANGHSGKGSKDAEAGEGDDDGDEDEEGQTCGMGPCAFRWALGIVALVLGIIVLAVLLSTLLSVSEEDTAVDGGRALDEDTGTAIAAKIGPYDGDKLLLVSRKDWGGKPPVSPPDPMTLPVPYVIVSHTATEHCSTFEDCAAVTRSVQDFHMGSRKWWDVGYNFLVGGDGRVYEGRGWDGVGAHARSYNNVSIGLSFIGTFSDVEPPQRQVKAAMRLIEEGVRLGKVANDYGLLGHRQVSPTESPGEKLYQILKTWPHWTELES